MSFDEKVNVVGHSTVFIRGGEAGKVPQAGLLSRNLPK